MEEQTEKKIIKEIIWKNENELTPEEKLDRKLSRYESFASMVSGVIKDNEMTAQARENLTYELVMLYHSDHPQIKDGYYEALKECQSPIEQGFFTHFHCQTIIESFYGHIESLTITTKSGSRTTLTEEPQHMIFIYPQKQINNMRVDFLIELSMHDCGVTETLKIVVECDGHDFHERTKEQAKKDRSRDRALQALGYRIMRFTGSELHKEPNKCAAEVMALILDHVKAFNDKGMARAEALYEEFLKQNQRNESDYESKVVQ